MQFEGAIIREQGVTFAVVIVKASVVQSRSSSQEAIPNFQPVFPGMPIVLMGQDSRGNPTYFGRTDIAKFLANTPLSAIPWQRYTLN
jgi:hypothetical protein